jgi:hypothetical protein
VPIVLSADETPAPKTAKKRKPKRSKFFDRKKHQRRKERAAALLSSRAVEANLAATEEGNLIIDESIAASPQVASSAPTTHIETAETSVSDENLVQSPDSKDQSPGEPLSMSSPVHFSPMSESFLKLYDLVRDADVATNVQSTALASDTISTVEPGSHRKTSVGPKSPSVSRITPGTSKYKPGPASTIRKRLEALAHTGKVKRG